MAQDDIGLNTVHVADLLFKLKAHNEALPLFRRLVMTPGDNELTWKLAVCLVETDRRREAQRFFDTLSVEVRSLVIFRRVEINLAGRMGDWSRMRLLLEAQLAVDPKSAEYIVSYADALFRSGDRDALHTFVSRDPLLEGASPDRELEFAKLQLHCGFADAGVLRLYRIFRLHPNSKKVASHFLGHLLMAQNLTVMDPPEVVGPATVVYWHKGSEKRITAIERDGVPLIDSWPELVDIGSDSARALLGRRAGDEVVMKRGMFEETVQIEAIGSLVGFAADKAHALIASSNNSDGPLWSVRIIKDDGDVDVDLLLRSSQERRTHIENTFNMYGQHRYPLAVLAQLIGADPIKLLLEWPSNLLPLFVGVGSEAERQLAFTLIGTGSRFVIDMMSIAELIRLGADRAVRELIGRPLVAQTQRESLLVMLASSSERQESANLSEIDGRLQITDVPAWYFLRRRKLLQSILDFVDNECDVVPTTGPEEITDVHQVLRRVLDSGTLDSIYLCLEHNAALLTEDGGLRAIAIEAGAAMSTNIQPLLMVARDRKLITQDRYADMLSVKLLAKHDFISVTAVDLLTIALKTPARIAPAAKAAFESFKSPTLQLDSGIKVSLEFLQIAVLRLPPSTWARYARLILEVLTHERAELSRLLVRILGRLVRRFFGRNARKLPRHVRREFGEELLRRR